ncbi:MAG: hypothetical protein R3Y28_08555 [Candidatus Gastranaerophilales bacterium]
MADLSVQTITDIAAFKGISFEQAQSLCQNSDSSQLANLIAQAKDFKETGVRNFVQSNTEYDGSQLFNYSKSSGNMGLSIEIRSPRNNYVEITPEELAQVEFEQSQKIAKDLCSLDGSWRDWSGNGLKSELSKLNKDNVVDVLNEYDKISKDNKSLVEYITGLSETNTHDKVKKQYIQIIYNALIAKVDELNIDVNVFKQEYTQIMAKKSTVQSMNGYSMSTAQTDVLSKTDATTLNNIIRGIKASIEVGPTATSSTSPFETEGEQNYENSVDNSSEHAFEFSPTFIKLGCQQGGIDLLQNRLKSAKDSFEQQVNYDGWSGKVANNISAVWGSHNRASIVEGDLQAYEVMLSELQEAQDKDSPKNLDLSELDAKASEIGELVASLNSMIEESNAIENEEEKLGFEVAIYALYQNYTEMMADYQEDVNQLELNLQEVSSGKNFEAKFEQTYGVKFDADKVQTFAINEEKLISAQSLATVEYTFNKEFSDLLNTDNPVATAEQLVTSKAKLASYLGDGDKNKGFELIEQIYASRLDENSTPQQEYEVLREIAKHQSQTYKSLLNEITEGKSIDYLMKKADDFYYAAYGAKNDIARRVQEYNHSQQVGAGAVKMTANIGLIVASGLIPGGQAASASMITKLAMGVGRAYLTGAGSTFITESTDVMSSKSRNIDEEWGNILNASNASGLSLAAFAGASSIANLAFAPVKMTAEGTLVSSIGLKTTQTTAKIASEVAPIVTGGAMKYAEEGEFTLAGQTESLAMLAGFKAMGKVQAKVLDNVAKSNQMKTEIQLSREALGIADDVKLTADVVKKAFRETVKTQHSDKGGNAVDMGVFTGARDLLMSEPVITKYNKAFPKFGRAGANEAGGTNSPNGKASNMPATEKTESTKQPTSTEVKVQKALPEHKAVEVKSEVVTDLAPASRTTGEKITDNSVVRISQSSVFNDVKVIYESRNDLIQTFMQRYPDERIDELYNLSAFKYIDKEKLTEQHLEMAINNFETIKAFPFDDYSEFLERVRPFDILAMKFNDGINKEIFNQYISYLNPGNFNAFIISFNEENIKYLDKYISQGRIHSKNIHNIDKMNERFDSLIYPHLAVNDNISFDKIITKDIRENHYIALEKFSDFLDEQGLIKLFKKHYSTIGDASKIPDEFIANKIITKENWLSSLDRDSYRFPISHFGADFNKVDWQRYSKIADKIDMEPSIISLMANNMNEEALIHLCGNWPSKNIECDKIDLKEHLLNPQKTKELSSTKKISLLEQCREQEVTEYAQQNPTTLRMFNEFKQNLERDLLKPVDLIEVDKTYIKNVHTLLANTNVGEANLKEMLSSDASTKLFIEQVYNAFPELKSLSEDSGFAQTLNKIINTDEYSSLDDKSKQQLKLAGLFSDINPDEAYSLMDKMNLTFETKRAVCYLLDTKNNFEKNLKHVVDYKLKNIALKFNTQNKLNSAKIYWDSKLNKKLTDTELAYIKIYQNHINNSGIPLFATQLPTGKNLDKIPTVEFNGHNYGVLNLTEIKGDISKYGFTKGTMAEDFTVDATFVRDLNEVHTILLTANPNRSSLLSSSKIGLGQKGTFQERKYGIPLKAVDQNDYIYASNQDTDIGHGVKSNGHETILFEINKQLTVTTKDSRHHISKFIKEKLELNDNQYRELYLQIYNKKYFTQINNLTIDGKKLSTERVEYIVSMLKEAQKQMVNTAGYKGSHNETNISHSEINSDFILAKVNDISEIDPEWLEYARLNNKKFIFIGTEMSNINSYDL